MSTRFTVIRNGFFDSIQDPGRYGYARWGVNPGGVMDIFAASTANSLVGNSANSPVVELHFPASEIHFVETSLIALTGAEFTAFINDIPIPLWRPMIIPANSTLTFRRKIFRERCYLAVQGSWKVDSWLGSASTNIRVGAGGINGRLIRRNDQVHIGDNHFSQQTFDRVRILPWRINIGKVYDNPEEIGFVQGPEWNWLDERSKEILLRSQISVDKGSDRMGYRLNHDPINIESNDNLVSSGVTFGTIQATPDGKTIILMADHQTTGGYPRVGYVIGAHLPKLSQLRPNSEFRFRDMKIDEAEKMLISLRNDMAKFERSCRDKLIHYHAGH